MNDFVAGVIASAISIAFGAWIGFAGAHEVWASAPSIGYATALSLYIGLNAVGIIVKPSPRSSE